MTFFYPNILWWLGLLVVPILLHLLRIRRLRRVYFTNLTSLSGVVAKQNSRSEIKRVLILISRLLIICFLVVTFARPQFRVTNTIGSTSIGALVIDNSLSSQRHDISGQPILYNIQPFIKKLFYGRSITNWKSYDNDGLVYGDSEVTQLGLTFSNISLKLTNGLQRIDKSISEIHIFSDFQNSTLGELEYLLNDTITNYYFHKLTSLNESNLYVDSVWLEYPIGYSNLNTINMVIVNDGETAKSNVLIRLERDSLQLNSEVVSIESKERFVMKFEFNPSSIMVGDYTIDVADNYAAFDNRFHFTIPRVQKTGVFILSDRLDNEGFVEKVFQNGNLFELNTGQLNDLSLVDLANSDFIILNELKTIPQWLKSHLDEINKNVLIIPRSDVDSLSYSSFLGFDLRNESMESGQLSTKAVDSPLLKGVLAGGGSNSSMPIAKPMFKLNGSYETVLSLDSQDPFCVKSNSGYYFFTTNWNDSQTNFHKHALFVPIMYNLSEPNLAQQLYVRNGQVSHSVNFKNTGVENVLKLKNEQFSYLVNYSSSNGVFNIALPDDLNQTGFYEVVLNDSTIATLAFNHNKNESLMDSYSIDELLELTKNAPHIKVDEVKNSVFETKFGQSRNIPLWKYALLLVLLFVSVESLILRFIK